MKEFFLKRKDKLIFYTIKLVVVAVVYMILGYYFEFRGHLKDVISFMIFLIPNHFIGFKGWRYFGKHLRMKKAVYWVIFWAIALSYIPGKMIDKFFPDSVVGDALLLLDSYWFTSREYILFILLFCMLLGFINKKTGFLGKKLTNALTNTPVLGLTLIILMVSYLLYGTLNAQNTVVTPYQLTVNKTAGSMQELHAVMISDMHLGRVVNNNRLIELVKKVNSLKPDIVLITGDSIEDDYTHYIKQNMATTLGKINSKYGVFAVLGNHDIAYGNTQINIANLSKAGIHVLKDKYVKVSDSFYLVGRSDRGEVGENSDREKLGDIIQGMDKNLPVILMDHQPVEFENAIKNGIDIQLSGHTNNGQEGINKLLCNLTNELSYGVLRKDKFSAIVSSGFGTWGSPVRVGTLSEIVDIKIHFQRKLK